MAGEQQGVHVLQGGQPTPLLAFRRLVKTGGILLISPIEPVLSYNALIGLINFYFIDICLVLRVYFIQVFLLVFIIVSCHG